MKNKELGINIRLPKEGLYSIFLERVASCKKSGKEIIRFPDIMSKLAVSFQIPKKKVWELLYLFKDIGLIEIICGHGVVINYEINENGSNKK